MSDHIMFHNDWRGICSKLWLFLPIVVFLLGCAPSVGMRPRSGLSSEIESFYLSENTTQYFIRPIVTMYKGISVSIDFTLRINDEKEDKDPVVCNYTLERNTSFDRFIILSFIMDDSDAVTPSQPEILFAEDEDRMIRFTSQIPYYAFLKIISAERIDLVILEGTKDFRFPINKKFARVQKQLEFLTH